MTHEEILEAEFNDLSRKAHEVMVKRLWFPRFIGSVDGKQQWVAYSWVGCSDLSKATMAFMALEPKQWVFEDPFVCLVKADEWYKANVERGQP